jgi:hypothetical protein
MQTPALEWSAAQVHDGSLSVQVSGDPDDEWADTFARTLILLSSDSDWGPATYDAKAGAVTVEGVSEGDEGKIRFSLDAAVQEANAHDAAQVDADPEDSEDETENEDRGDDADTRMTDRFRDA